MNTKRILALGFTLTLTLLLIAGCTAPQAAPCPTAEPLSCPTAAAQVQPTMNDWRIGYNDLAHVRITFSPEKKCSVEVLKPATDAGQFGYEIVVNDQTYQNYMVVAVTLDEGKTLKDLEEYHKTVVGQSIPAPFSQLQIIEVVPPMTRIFHITNLLVSPLYLVCFIQGPDNQQVIDEFGPFDIAQE